MKRSLCLVFPCLLCCFCARAQNWGWENDEEAFHFTYTLQYVTSQYKVYHAAGWQNPLMENNVAVSPPLTSIKSSVTSGFAIGLGITKDISYHTQLRLVPTLTLADRNLQYEYRDRIENLSTGMPDYYKDRKVQASLVEFPLSVKFRSDRRKNFGAYLTGGGKYSADISSARRSDDTEKVAFEKMLKNKSSYFSYEAGLGFDLYFKFFTLSPEIKYSSSINSILKQDNNAFSKPLDKLMLRNVTFSLYIQ
jgi:hypothetical protein